MSSYVTCTVCIGYAERRMPVLAPEIASRSFVRVVSAAVVLREYMEGVHARHLAGKSLSTRPVTPRVKTETGTQIRVQRACNGCGKGLGDAREDELDAAVAGLPLPDVRLECGCLSDAA